MNTAPHRKKRGFIEREVWLEAAYKMLVKRGIDNVRILNLAEMLGVTRGSFYWRFESRSELLDELIENWHRTNTAALTEAANARPPTLPEWYVNLMRVWLDATHFDVQLDIAVRDWARKDKAVFKLVQAEDQVRIQSLTRAFQDLGRETERLAFTRARILYYQQMGYYMIGVQDPPELRAGYLSEYCLLFTGQQVDEARVGSFIDELTQLVT